MKSLTAGKNRIELLDSFRCIAVLLVILIHYGVSYPEYYPYGNKFSDILIFKSGFLGVHLFFLISGFVIFMTLEKCGTMKEFLIKRITRLFPAMLFCSVLTFFFFLLFDHKSSFPRFHNSLIDFLPGFTFTDLWIWNLIFHRQVEYIDGVYWTLSYEMKFYILAAVVYFFNRKTFFNNWIKLVFIILSLFFITAYIVSINHNPLFITLQRLIQLCLIPEYIILFTLGMYFFVLFHKKKVSGYYWFLMLLFTAVELYIFNTLEVQLYILAFITAFIIFIYKSNWLSFLSNRFFTTIGLISYPLYLIHAHIGVFFISKISALFNYKINPVAVITITIVIVSTAAYFIHIYIENPANKFLRNCLLKKKPPEQKLKADFTEQV